MTPLYSSDLFDLDTSGVSTPIRRTVSCKPDDSRISTVSPSMILSMVICCGAGVRFLLLTGDRVGVGTIAVSFLGWSEHPVMIKVTRDKPNSR